MTCWAAIVEFNENVDAEAMLRALWPTGHFSSDENRVFQTSSFLANTRIDAVVASPRSVLIGPEDTMKKMLAKSDTSRNLLLKQLESVTTLADFHVEYVGSPTWRICRYSPGRHLASKC